MLSDWIKMQYVRVTLTRHQLLCILFQPERIDRQKRKKDRVRNPDWEDVASESQQERTI